MAFILHIEKYNDVFLCMKNLHSFGGGGKLIRATCTIRKMDCWKVGLDSFYFF